MNNQPFSLFSCNCNKENIRMININGAMVGIIDLDPLFLEIYLSEIKDEDDIKDALLKGAKRSNYINEKLEPQYREALFEEYKKFLKRIKE